MESSYDRGKRVARETDNTKREAKGESADAAAASEIGKADLGAAARKAKGFEAAAVDDRPKAMPGEGPGAFAARMSDYRKRKQAAQSAALK